MKAVSAVPRMHLGYVWVSAAAASLGGLLFGYDWVVIGGAKPFYEAFFGLNSPSLEGWAMSCALLGCLAGALLSGEVSEGLGRKRSLIIAALIFTASSLGTALSNSFSTFVVWRILGGVAIGLASCLSPVYIAELAPAAVRGMFVSLNELAIVLGILCAQTANFLIARPIPAGFTTSDILRSWNGQMGWRWMFGVTAIPSAIFFLAMLFAPESPRWLAPRNPLRARAVLDRIGGEAYALRVFAEIQATWRTGDTRREWHVLAERKNLRILLLGLALAALQQWCGINVLFNYAQEIFTAAGFTMSSMLFNILVTGVVMVAFTIVSLFMVDRFGRRVLMLGGCAGLSILYFAFGVLLRNGGHRFALLFLVLAAIACYAMTLAPMTWVILSEIFPNRIRGLAMAMATTSLWAACFVLTYTFPLLNRALGVGPTVWIYALVCACGFVLVWKKLPETKGKTLEAIESSWR